MRMLPDGYIQGELFPDMVEESKTLEDYYMMLEKLEPDDVELSETEREQLQCNEYISWDEFKKECGIVNVPYKRFHQNANKPFYATPGSAGFDLAAVEDALIVPGQRTIVRTGLGFELPENTFLMVVPRSGVSVRTSLRVANAPGIIDEDYRGEVGVIVENTFNRFEGRREYVLDLEGFEIPHRSITAGTYIIRKGDRIAQGIIVPYIRVEFQEVQKLSDSIRGQGGFGSTGK